MKAKCSWQLAVGSWQWLSFGGLRVCAQKINRGAARCFNRRLLLPNANCQLPIFLRQLPTFSRQLPAILAFVLLVCTIAQAQTKRVVVIKVDGLSDAMVDEFVHERDPRTGKSLLPWIEHVFYERGTRIANFYVRGTSLSAPSWSLLDTGQHLQIKGNVEFDRYTLHAYDYLNFIPFYFNSALSRRVDMPGVETLDEVGMPLLLDAYPYTERYQSFQLYQRGLRWTTLQRGLQNRITSRSPRDLIDEWTTGFESRSIVMDQLERELIEKLNDPKVLYLDYYTTEVDHVEHHNRDRESHLFALKELDGVVGRIWTAVQKSPLADKTAVLLLSDHGSNTDDRIYSQGFNLVKLLGSAAGGGHHVITKRRLLLDYSIKGINPLVPLITTTTNDSFYLKGQSTDYPTALLDFDGNERATIQLRDSDLNVLHILLQQLQRKDISQTLRRAATNALFLTLERRRASWQSDLTQMTEEMDALHHEIERLRPIVAALPKKWTKEDYDAGHDKEAGRVSAQLEMYLNDEREYTAYLRTLKNLLALKPEGFDPAHLKIEDLIAKGAMGDHNTIYQLQNYVAGIAAGGLVLNTDGQLDMRQSFTRVDYFSLLHDAAVRNNVQPGVDTHPVDFVAVRIPREAIAPVLPQDLMPDDDAIWINGGPEQQALILSRTDAGGQLSLRYLPISNLTQDANGSLRFTRAAWRAGLPLKMLEDAQLRVPNGSRAAWLGEWHTDVEWLRALHKTAYSNALVGLHEQIARHYAAAFDADAPGISADERLMRRFRKRQRMIAESDLLLLANNHWNFDVRGFNPGGNHGSFFRISTHSTLMFAGGARTGIPRGLTVEEPYDSLSIVPTVFALTGRIRDGLDPIPVLYERGFRTFPGRVIREVLSDKDRPAPVAEGTELKP